MTSSGVFIVKHQGRLKVLQKLYYSQRDISATLVEAVFKLIKVELQFIIEDENEEKCFKLSGHKYRK